MNVRRSTIALLRPAALLFVALLATVAIETPAQASPPYDAAAVMFAQMMIPHHQQAVLISQWALKQSTNPTVKKLAARIISEQSPEVAQMKKWVPTKAMTGMSGMDHQMSMPGMVTTADLAKLSAAIGKKFDGLYLVNMTLHHQGAIAMATPLNTSKNPEVAALTKAIVMGQRAEIAEMHRIMVTGK